MPERERARRLFSVFAAETLAKGRGYWWRPRGFSMRPAIRDAERVLVEPVDVRTIRVGDIVKVEEDGGFRMHRVTARVPGEGFRLRGDSDVGDHGPVHPSRVIGIAVAVERDGRVLPLRTFPARLAWRLRALRRAMARRWSARSRVS